MQDALLGVVEYAEAVQDDHRVQCLVVAVHQLPFVRTIGHDGSLTELGLDKVCVVLKELDVEVERFIFSHAVPYVFVRLGDRRLVIA